jgi:hypothetical protein
MMLSERLRISSAGCKKQARTGTAMRGGTREGQKSNLTSRQVLRVSNAYYQAFFWVLIDLIVELLGLIIKPFDNQTES